MIILVSSCYDKNIRFWDPLSGHVIKALPDFLANRLVVSPGKTLLAAGGNPQIRFYEVNSSANTHITQFDGHTNNVCALGFQKEERWMFSVSEDATIKVWDIRAPGCQREYNNKTLLTCGALHPNQAEIAFGDQSGQVGIWDLAANKCSRILRPGGETAVRSVAFSPDGTFLVAGNNKGILYPIKLSESENSSTSLNPIKEVEAHKSYVLKTTFSSDGRMLANTSADHTTSLWEVNRNEPENPFRLVKTLTGHQRWVGIAYSLLIQNIFLQFLPIIKCYYGM